MVKQFIIRNTNLHIIHYLTIHYAIYLIYFKKYCAQHSISISGVEVYIIKIFASCFFCYIYKN